MELQLTPVPDSDLPPAKPGYVPQEPCSLSLLPLSFFSLLPLSFFSFLCSLSLFLTLKSVLTFSLLMLYSNYVSIFQQEDGGFRSTNRQDKPCPVLYYIGIIDILQAYNYKKQIEHSYKATMYDQKVSIMVVR